MRGYSWPSLQKSNLWTLSFMTSKLFSNWIVDIWRYTFLTLNSKLKNLHKNLILIFSFIPIVYTLFLLRNKEFLVRSYLWLMKCQTSRLIHTYLHKYIHPYIIHIHLCAITFGLLNMIIIIIRLIWFLSKLNC